MPKHWIYGSKILRHILAISATILSNNCCPLQSRILKEVHNVVPLSRQISSLPPSKLTPYKYNSLLSSSKDPTSTLHLFLHMHSNSVPLDSYSFPPVLSAASSLPYPLPSLTSQFHALMVKALPPHSSPIPFTALLDLYSKSACPADALKVFIEIPHRDSITWNSTISCLVRHGCVADAISMFQSMVNQGVPFTVFTVSMVLKACSATHALRLAQQVHARVVVARWGDSVVTATALIDLYMACGLVRDASKVFYGLDCRGKDNAVCNVFLCGLVSNRRYEEAWLILGKMMPSRVAFTIALGACSESLNLAYGREIHCAVVRRGLCWDTMLCNALLDMYAKLGEIAAARMVFKRIHEKSVVSWTSIIDAYGSQGLGSEALGLFRIMEEEGDVLPNDVTFLSILSACAHSGMVEEGGNCFFSMKDKYGIDPRPEHYACYIDILGRAGRIKEAWELFYSVGKLTSGVCVAMLNACRVAGDLVRGEIVIQHLLEMDPKNPGIRVLISNFYADAGSWEGVEDLRKTMWEQGLRKQVGSSLLAV